MKKRCTKCGKKKDLGEFAIKKTASTGCASECKMCHRLIRNAFYDRNKDSEKSRVRTRKLEIRAWFRKFKATLCCSVCPESDPACLTFHHRDPATKEISIAFTINRHGWSKKRILAEVAKCDVLCANCHMKLHAETK